MRDHSGALNPYFSSAAPDRRSLGAIFGLLHVVNSVVSTVGPAAADWLFAFSLTHSILGGKLFLGVVCVELGGSMQLPKNTS
ncbi:hypothetical protein H4582DRAFT_1918122 [Lactarius indigo]|nr:hypothetical protein H4582DRAFT_1918122 [Lactarius indigo]